jgi:hypothetical protein
MAVVHRDMYSCTEKDPVGRPNASKQPSPSPHAGKRRRFRPNRSGRCRYREIGIRRVATFRERPRSSQANQSRHEDKVERRKSVYCPAHTASRVMAPKKIDYTTSPNRQFQQISARQWKRHSPEPRRWHRVSAGHSACGPHNLMEMVLKAGCRRHPRTRGRGFGAISN